MHNDRDALPKLHGVIVRTFCSDQNFRLNDGLVPQVNQVEKFSITSI
jgi:hypothetical protein